MTLDDGTVKLPNTSESGHLPPLLGTLCHTIIMCIQCLAPLMPECQNCGSFVTAAYARVFTPNGVEEPRVCPQCEDKIRDGSDVREARSTRRT